MSNWVRIFKRGVSHFRAGQPIHETRPHYIKSGDLTPMISALEYFDRRIKLSEIMKSESIAIIPGSSVKYASGAVFYPFQQNNDLFYLTGWNEPDSVLILEKTGSNPEDLVMHMAVPPADPAAEQWEGERTGVDGVAEIFNADVSLANKDINNHLKSLLKKYRTVYYDFDSKASLYKASTIEQSLRECRVDLNPLAPHITAMRAIKSNSELHLMRLAGKISGRAYNQAYAQRFQTEKGLHSFLEYRFISGGCDKSAYVPVVAGGNHALCIHYVRNDDVLRDGEMVLVDAAGQLGGYCADISRTWPVNGKFTPAQAELYEAVLTVQRNLIKECTVDKGHSLNGLHNLSVQWMTKELQNVGFTGLAPWETSKFLYPHYVGHNLGLDVHDCGLYSKVRPLQRGQVITIEPGVYIPDDPKWPAHFRNIGIRIEDDIAVGQNAYVNLTVEACKEIVDIETIAQSGEVSHANEEVRDIYAI